MANSSTNFGTLLIANRGEIAVRIIRTARRMGYRTVALYSEPDEGALHAKLADLAIAIKGRTAIESYLSIDKVIDACALSGADAVHPGYGFLSENAAFAQACLDEDLIFIGPTPQVIDAMGNKTRAKELMIKSGIQCVPGYQGAEQEIAQLMARGTALGFPLMIKSAAGGGGRGLRLVHSKEELKDCLVSARNEAERAFGSGELLLERALIDARHVEIQIVADKHGNIIHLGERDCSIQRRHQKVFEESPSPAVNAPLRERIGQSAVAAASAVGYEGVGTCEFLLDANGEFYFLEMNTRLQVEHPVTELVTGIDLVEWQLRIAGGEPLPLCQDEVEFAGHAIEARLCAEDPGDQFRPQAGPIHLWLPPSEDYARTDHGLNEIDRVSPYYDSMLAKIISYGEDRESARRSLLRAVSDTVILGLKTNREFLIDCLKNEEFISGKANTGFIERTWQPEQATDAIPDLDTVTLAAVLLLVDAQPEGDDLTGWSSNADMRAYMALSVNEKEAIAVEISFRGQSHWQMNIGSWQKEVKLSDLSQFTITVTIDGRLVKAHYVMYEDTISICTEHSTASITDLLLKPPGLIDTVSDGSIVSPSNGLVGSIQVVVNQKVEKGDPICTVDAMKLIQTVYAPVSGRIASINCCAGDQVHARQLLATIEEVNGG